MTALNPVMQVGDQIAEVLDIHTKLERARAARARARGDAVGAPARARAHDRRLSAPALRRAAPAHHDRGRAGARSGAADRRRADHRARRHHAGADPEADQGAARAAQHRRAVHHARFRRGRRGRAPRRGDAARPRGRAGHDRGRAAPAARRLHPHADPLGAEPLAARARRRSPTAPIVLQTERADQDLRVGRLLREAPRGARPPRTSTCTSGAARRSAWSASPAPASRRSRAASRG